MKPIIIIDDDALSVYLNSLMLREAIGDVEIITFSTIEEALKHFESSGFIAPSLILLDINLPAMDAWDFLEILNKQDRQAASLPIVLLSSYLSPTDKQQLIRHDMEDAVLIKPLQIDQLLKLEIIQE